MIFWLAQDAAYRFTLLQGSSGNASHSEKGHLRRRHDCVILYIRTVWGKDALSLSAMDVFRRLRKPSMPTTTIEKIAVLPQVVGGTTVVPAAS